MPSEKVLGMKFDGSKPQMGLLPPYSLEEVAKVLTFGAQKYLPHNWKYVEGAESRYINAAMRHINDYLKSERSDPESGLHHLAHAICCLMFIVDLQLDPKLNANQTEAGTRMPPQAPPVQSTLPVASSPEWEFQNLLNIPVPTNVRHPSTFNPSKTMGVPDKVKK